MALRLDEAKRCHCVEEIGFDLPETGLAPVNQIHLVDGKQDAGNAHQRENRRMPARLLLQALPGIDQHDRRVGVAGAARHVAGVLVVARAIDEDQTALRGIKIAPSHIDGYALLPFCDEAIEQETVIEVWIARGFGSASLPFLAGHLGDRMHPTEGGRSRSICRHRRSRR